MVIDEIRKPRLSGYTAEDDIRQLKSYLFQLADQLNRTFSDIDKQLERLKTNSEKGGQ